MLITRSGEWGDEKAVRLESGRGWRSRAAGVSTLAAAGSQFLGSALASPSPLDLSFTGIELFTQPQRAVPILVSRVTAAVLTTHGKPPTIAPLFGNVAGQVASWLWLLIRTAGSGFSLMHRC